jgi:hypothetical protein
MANKRNWITICPKSERCLLGSVSWDWSKTYWSNWNYSSPNYYRYLYLLAEHPPSWDDHYQSYLYGPFVAWVDRLSISHGV